MMYNGFPEPLHPEKLFEPVTGLSISLLSSHSRNRYVEWLYRYGHWGKVLYPTELNIRPKPRLNSV